MPSSNPSKLKVSETTYLVGKQNFLCLGGKLRPKKLKQRGKKKGISRQSNRAGGATVPFHPPDDRLRDDKSGDPTPPSSISDWSDSEPQRK